MDFSVSADYSVKVKEVEKLDKYQDPAEELKKLWYQKATVISIIVGTLGMIGGIIETILKQQK